MLFLLAAAPAEPGRLLQDILPWIGALVLLVVVGGVFIALTRRAVHSGGDASPAGFSLHELRQLHKAGELTDEEFQRARDMLIGAYRSAEPAGGGEAKADAGGRKTPPQDR